MNTIGGSRKLTGLVLVIGALLLLFAVYLIASIWINVSDVVITAISTSITGLGMGHQGAQAAQDRAQAFSPNYPYPPTAPAAPAGPKIP